MKLVIIRHGDPDYANDCLTQKGQREADLLAERVQKLNADHYYCSPLGRAVQTSEIALKNIGKSARVLPWLEEFTARVSDPQTGQQRIAWDLLPSFWATQPDMFEKDKWFDTPIMRDAKVGEKYREVCSGLDALLEKHGYRRDGCLYRAVRSNDDTVVLFCHFAIESVMVSHLLNISFPAIVHGFFAATTSVTVLETEERHGDIAYFRCRTFGDTSHLYAGGEPLSEAGFNKH